MRCADPQGHPMSREGATGQEAVQVSRRAIDRPQDPRRPRTHSRGAKAALGTMAGGTWRQTITEIISAYRKSSGRVRTRCLRWNGKTLRTEPKKLNESTQFRFQGSLLACPAVDGGVGRRNRRSLVTLSPWYARALLPFARHATLNHLLTTVRHQRMLPKHRISTDPAHLF